jgi:hypothetical protein
MFHLPGLLASEISFSNFEHGFSRVLVDMSSSKSLVDSPLTFKQVNDILKHYKGEYATYNKLPKSEMDKMLSDLLDKKIIKVTYEVILPKEELNNTWNEAELVNIENSDITPNIGGGRRRSRKQKLKRKTQRKRR